MAATSALRLVKTLSFPLAVLDAANVEDLLNLVTSVDGVVAALVEREGPGLQILVRSDASALLVREELRAALSAAWTYVAA